MSKKMLIDAVHPEETRVVVLNGHRVEEFDFESRSRKQLRGNIYLAKVTRVEPSLQAAFIEYGGNRHGFLAFNEIHPDYYQIPHADREALMRDAEAEDDPHEAAEASARGEDSEIGEDADSHHEATTEALGGEDDDDIDEELERRRRRMMRRYKIQEVIKRRQIMLVQVVKEERGNKGAALTTYLSLAGRYGVLMPNTDRGGGISRKITAVADRKRLRNIVAELDVPEGMGLIVRTAGAKRSKAEITRDYEYLSRLWSRIRDTTLHSIAPALIYEEEDLVKRAIRDMFDKDVETIQVEGEAGYREARDFMRMLMPSQAKKIERYRGGPPLFVGHKVEDTLAQIYSPVAPLKSGGYLVINQTEALVAIDVNSGRSTRERNVETTAVRTNLEAAEEAARQIRLRDLAGLIVIDFIDMDEAKNNRAVEKTLKDCLSLDRARIQMGRISPFGLMEISRQRRRTGILEGTTHVCPHCQGAGRVRSIESSALAALRAVDLEALEGGGEIALRVAPDAALYILNQKREYLLRLERGRGLFVNVISDAALNAAEHAIERLSHEPFTIDPAWAERESVEGADLEDDDFVDDTLDDEDAFPEPLAADEDDDEDDGVLRVAEDDDEDLTGSGAARRDEDGGRRRGRKRRRGRREGDSRNEAAPVLSDSVSAPLDESGDRRRRRGRRGGRRSREEGPGADVYAWSWPARLSGEDTYEWRGPIARDLPPEPSETQPARPALEAPAQSPAARELSSAPEFSSAEAELPTAEGGAGTEMEVWVELDEPAPKPERKRRRRGSRAADPIAESEVETPVEEGPAPTPVEPPPSQVEAEAPAPEPAHDPSPVVAEPEPTAPEPAPAPAPAPELVAADTSPPQPDPAEIIAPPPTPKRGWWRTRA